MWCIKCENYQYRHSLIFHGKVENPRFSRSTWDLWSYFILSPIVKISIGNTSMHLFKPQSWSECRIYRQEESDPAFRRLLDGQRQQQPVKFCNCSFLNRFGFLETVDDLSTFIPSWMFSMIAKSLVTIRGHKDTKWYKSIVTNSVF